MRTNFGRTMEHRGGLFSDRVTRSTADNRHELVELARKALENGFPISREKPQMQPRGHPWRQRGEPK